MIWAPGRDIPMCLELEMTADAAAPRHVGVHIHEGVRGEGGRETASRRTRNVLCVAQLPLWMSCRPAAPGRHGHALAAAIAHRQSPPTMLQNGTRESKTRRDNGGEPSPGTPRERQVVAPQSSHPPASCTVWLLAAVTQTAGGQELGERAQDAAPPPACCRGRPPRAAW